MHPITFFCRILTLMKRLLILIFAFNALFITPVSARAVCEMMGEAVEISSGSMSVINCPQCEKQCEKLDCGSLQCDINSSSVTTPVPFSEKQTLFIVAGNLQAHAGFAYFYKIVLPINTPPPLV